ncbi:tyrosine-type recombinase/integrase [Halostagnicola kamekurae]|uniref:Site-specific recombinase XerD n=1 Tax=Halostagnicola kamekurae TaxID=619731 RepID=A0A1I6UNQ8_9EURY|nr:tyrosine-type recombinase/integrase [Halostagnicola kamekurae]SFT03004.1 Site-specific recombinase XerD [Halostagnicola kamekurae]
MSGSTDRRAARGGTTVEEAVSRYLGSLDSGGSRSTMRSPLNEFANFCDGEGVQQIDALETNTLREYGMYLRERAIDQELAASTANTYFNYVRAFLSFCVRDELLDTNPANTQRAEEFLPEDKGDRNRQFWDPEDRQQLINYVTERVDMALEGTIDVSRKIAYRDRAIVVLLADAGVRGAELFRDPRDDARNGVTWGDVDLENHSLEVFGKSRQYERVGLPSAAREALERYRRVVEPPTDAWPIFPTGHAPSKYAVYREVTGEDPDKNVDIDDVLRTAEIPPPALTKAGGRSVMKRLTKEAGIDFEDGSYLKPHGARRALGAELYKKGHSELAQSALRHKSIETTHESYSDIQAKDVAEGIDEVRE